MRDVIWRLLYIFSQRARRAIPIHESMLFELSLIHWEKIVVVFSSITRMPLSKIANIYNSGYESPYLNTLLSVLSPTPEIA